MLFSKSKRVFALVLQTESRHFQIHEDKANAHAGMPYCGVFQFALPASLPVFGRMAKGNSPYLWGVGRLCLSCRGSLEPRLDKCNDLRLFCFLTKFGTVPC